MSSGSSVKRKVKPAFSSRNIAGKTVAYFAPVAENTKFIELKIKDIGANAVDTRFTTSVTDGSIN